MTTARSKVIKVTEDTAIGDLLEQVEDAPLTIEKDGFLYRLDRVQVATDEEDVWAGYDPEAALAGIEAAAGSWADVDAEELKAYIYRGREEGSRPPDRP